MDIMDGSIYNPDPKKKKKIESLLLRKIQIIERKDHTSVSAVTAE